VAAEPGPDLALAVRGAEGEGALRVGGRELRVRWHSGEPGADSLALPADERGWTLRGWEPGDRIRTRAGTRTLKKVFHEARIPRRERSRIPVLADADGRVLWAAGVARAADATPTPGGPALTITITDA